MFLFYSTENCASLFTTASSTRLPTRFSIFIIFCLHSQIIFKFKFIFLVLLQEHRTEWNVYVVKVIATSRVSFLLMHRMTLGYFRKLSIAKSKKALKRLCHAGEEGKLKWKCWDNLFVQLATVHFDCETVTHFFLLCQTTGCFLLLRLNAKSRRILWTASVFLALFRRRHDALQFTHMLARNKKSPQCLHLNSEKPDGKVSCFWLRK